LPHHFGGEQMRIGPEVTYWLGHLSIARCAATAATAAKTWAYRIVHISDPGSAYEMTNDPGNEGLGP